MNPAVTALAVVGHIVFLCILAALVASCVIGVVLAVAVLVTEARERLHTFRQRRRDVRVVRGRVVPDSISEPHFTPRDKAWARRQGVEL